jgi:hypothetical protein
MSTTPVEAFAIPEPSGNTVGLEVARPHLVRQVTETIAEQSFTGMVGEAELGKTGILNAALRQLASRRSTIVKLDLDSGWSPNRLAWQWARQLATAAVGAVPISHLEALDRSMWPASTRSAVLSLPGALGAETAALAQAPQPAKGIGRDDALQAPLQATLALAGQRQLILAIDHLETPSAAGLRSPDVAGLLWSIRAPGQHLPTLHVVVATRPAAQELASGTPADILPAPSRSSPSCGRSRPAVAASIPISPRDTQGSGPLRWSSTRSLVSASDTTTWHAAQSSMRAACIGSAVTYWPPSRVARAPIRPPRRSPVARSPKPWSACI